jgi:hypothetical protein
MPDLDLPARHIGTEAGGFSITYVLGGHTLHVKCWGYWAHDTAVAFGRDAQLACRRVSAPLAFTLDASALKPQSGDGQESLRALFGCLANTTLSGAIMFGSDILTKMQLRRLATECGVGSVLHFGDRPPSSPPSAV